MTGLKECSCNNSSHYVVLDCMIQVEEENFNSHKWVISRQLIQAMQPTLSDFYGI